MASFWLGCSSVSEKSSCDAVVVKIAGLKISARYAPVRLVKGAYWDYEIKKAQQGGINSYPVFTRKNHTDISYLTCAQFLLKHPDLFYGQFGTHNAHTMASIHVYAQATKITILSFSACTAWERRSIASIFHSILRRSVECMHL